MGAAAIAPVIIKRKKVVGGARVTAAAHGRLP
jgi:hypothetical protein